jgi:hypothetical protein
MIDNLISVGVAEWRKYREDNARLLRELNDTRAQLNQAYVENARLAQLFNEHQAPQIQAGKCPTCGAFGHPQPNIEIVII